MITRDRPELTEQCIRSMRENAADWSRHRLVVVFDGTVEEMIKLPPTHLQGMFARGVLCYNVVATGEQLGVGGAKNYGAAIYYELWQKDRADRPPLETCSGLLMFSDNDMWYGPGWDHLLEIGMSAYSEVLPRNELIQLGGWRHPYHERGRVLMEGGWLHHGTEHSEGSHVIHEVDAVTGNCFVIRWSDWLKYGPFDSNAIGPGQSEDYALSQRIRAGGGLVATLDPPVAIHCGLVNSIGEPATGWRECEEQITEQLAGLSAEMRESVLIMRPVPNAAKMRQMGFESAKRAQVGDMRMTEVGTWDFGDPRLPVRWGGLGVDPGVLSSDLGYSDWLAQQAVEQAKTKLDMQPRDPIAAFRALVPKPDIGSPSDEWTIGNSDPRTAFVIDVDRCPNPDFASEINLQARCALNIGSGQRRFDNRHGWINVDVQSVPPDRVPDLVYNVGVERLPFDDNVAGYVVLHQIAEHFGCGESEPMLRECWRVLARGGSLIITVPDMRKLAARWLGGELDTQLFMTNVYGAYMGDEADRHKWGMDRESLKDYLRALFGPQQILDFDWRPIPGADIAEDWWILGVEVKK